MAGNFIDSMKNKTDYLTEQEIDRMLTYCYDNGRMRDFMLILTLFRTGRRISEIVGEKPYTRNVGLRPIDIRFDEGLIEFDILKKNPVKIIAKSGRRRNPLILKEMRIKKLPKRKLIPVDEGYLDSIKKYVDIENIGLRKRIFPLHRTRVNQIIWDVTSACRIARPNQKIHPHSMRHSFAINFLKKNEDNPAALIHLQYLLDHGDLRTTAIYAQFTPSDMRKSLEKAHGDMEH